MAANATPKASHAPGVISNRFVSSAVEWRGKHKAAEKAIKRHIPGLQVVTIQEGTRGRPVDSITILLKPGTEPQPAKKLTQRIEGVLKTLFNLVIDYRVVSIN